MIANHTNISNELSLNLERVEVLVDLLIDAEPDGDENAAKRSTLHFFLEEQIGHLRCLVDDLQRTSHSLIPQGLEVQP
jgi:hypothetical protein